MSPHKAPTAVTIAPTQEKSGFGLWIDRYWKVGLAIVGLVTIWILYETRASGAKRTDGEAAWSKVLGVASEDPQTGMLTGAPEELQKLEGELKGKPAGAWALYLAATSAFAKRDFEKAETALADLQRGYPNHPLVTQAFSSDGKASPESVAKHLSGLIDAERAFLRDHPDLFENPPLPSDAPRVRLTTDRGPIVVGLYSDIATKYSDNFIKLVRDGVYVGTKFHLISPGQFIQGGDPNSKEGDPSTWGQGGPGYTLDREDTKLRHFTGVISAVSSPNEVGKCSGSLFVITTADSHVLDESYVPFGKILEGLDVVRAIEFAPLAEKSVNRPKDPVAIQSAEVL